MTDLLRRIQKVIEQQMWEDTTFSRMAMNDPNFLADLRAGRQLRRRTVYKIEQFLAPYEQRAAKAAARARK